MSDNPTSTQNIQAAVEMTSPASLESLTSQAPAVQAERKARGFAATRASEATEEENSEKLGMLMDVSLLVTVELGRTHLTVKEVLDLQKGSVVELNRTAGEAVDIYVNEHLLARGEVVVVDDKFGVRITEILGKGQSGDEK
jgi:flagellar motor switch protein FliN/FliY